MLAPGTSPAIPDPRESAHINRSVWSTSMSRMSVATRAGALLLAVGVLGASGCYRQVTRIAPEQAIDLSGRWNDVDSRLVRSEERRVGKEWESRRSRAE